MPNSPNGTNGVKRKRKSAQRGVQAVFTPKSDRKGIAELVLGLCSIVVGAVSWIYSSKSLGGLGLGNIIPWSPTAASFLLPVSIPLLVGGVGVSTYYFAMKRTWRASNRIESAMYELEALASQRNGLGESSNGSETPSRIIPQQRRRFSFGPSALGFALAEAIILLVIYGGLVQEYTSNLNMQNWVRSNFSMGSYLLTYNAVLGLAGILGVILFQLLPRKIRSARINPQQ